MFAYCGNDPGNNKDASGHRHVNNRESLLAGWKPIVDESKYIQDQSGEDVGGLRFGLANVSHGGCGAVATYNALVTMGEDPDFMSIIAEYEQSNSLLLFGFLGMMYCAVSDYFNSKGYSVTTICEPELLDYCIKNSDAAIIWYVWFDPSSNKIGAHFFHVKYSGGQYVAYNLYSDQTSPYCIGSSMRDDWPSANSGLMVLICINKE